MTRITLTPEQMESIRNDYFMKVSMLTDAEILLVANKVNNVVNLPFLNEEKELIIIVRVIHWIDCKLYRLLPNEYYQLIRNSADGISQDEADLIVSRITPLISNLIDIPYIPESLEKRIIALVLSLIVNAMIKGFKLQE